MSGESLPEPGGIRTPVRYSFLQVYRPIRAYAYTSMYPYRQTHVSVMIGYKRICERIGIYQIQRKQRKRWRGKSHRTSVNFFFLYGYF